MKKFGWLLTIMLGVLCPNLHAAEYGALSERSAGRVLGVRMQDGYRFFVFVRPMPMDTWLCREYISGKEVEVYPKKLELMPFFDENDDFAIELLTTWHLLHPRMPEYARYAAFAQMIKLPRVSRTRHFIEMIRRQEKEIAELKKKYQQTLSQSRASGFSARGEDSPGCGFSATYSVGADDNIAKSAMVSAIVDLINEGEVFREIDAVYQSRDYFLTTAFLDHYRDRVRQWLTSRTVGSRDDFADIRQKFDSIEKTLVANYRSERETYFQLEDDFSRICPRQRGLWKQSAPVSFGELRQRNNAAFCSWQQSRDLSPDCDFPEWGNHMLDILSLMPAIDDHEPVVRQFKEALKKYQEAFASEVN